jgi:hypothetical protein
MTWRIAPEVLRAAWLGFAPLAAWVVCLAIVVVAGKAEKRRLLKLLLWILPVFLLCTAWVLFLVVMYSSSPF